MAIVLGRAAGILKAEEVRHALDMYKPPRSSSPVPLDLRPSFM